MIFLESLINLLFGKLPVIIVSGSNLLLIVNDLADITHPEAKIESPIKEELLNKILFPSSVGYSPMELDLL